MSAASDFLENKILDHIYGGPDYVRPATLYVALYTSAPTDAGGGTEVAGGAYARAAVTNNATNFPAAAAGSKTNGTVITYAQASAAWGSIVAFGIFDALTGGNLIVHNLLPSPKPTAINDTLSLPIGSLTLTAS